MIINMLIGIQKTMKGKGLHHLWKKIRISFIKVKKHKGQNQ